MSPSLFLPTHVFFSKHPVLNSEYVKWDPWVNVKRNKQDRIIRYWTKSLEVSSYQFYAAHS